MSPVFHRQTYDRTRILKQAEEARVARKWRRAVALYRRVIAAEPRNVELHLRIAPVLVRTGERFDAWISFDRAGRACVESGQSERALTVYRAAAKHLPGNYAAWCAVADLELRQKRPKQAREALVEGRSKMRGRRYRPEAIALLRAARDLDPSDFDLTLDLARELARTRQQAEARFLLAKAAEAAGGRALRRVRGLAWRLDPSLRNTWAWFRAVWQARGDRRMSVSERTRLAA